MSGNRIMEGKQVPARQSKKKKEKKMNPTTWTKKTVNLRLDEIERLNAAAKRHGYKNLHEAMRSLTLSLLENPTAA